MTNGPGRIELGRILAGENHAPVVYFARIADKVKIGTTTNLKQRMRSFYLDLSDVLVVVPGDQKSIGDDRKPILDGWIGGLTHIG